MYVHNITNLPKYIINKLYAKFINYTANQKSLWQGTVFVGTEPVYINCYDKNLSTKIPNYFVKTDTNTKLSQSPELYVITTNTSDFINSIPQFNEAYRCVCGTNIQENPDLITTHELIFFRINTQFFLIKNFDNNYLYLGENHLFMKLWKYILWDSKTSVIHGAVVGTNNKGVLISGLSGAGKSTLAAYCVKHGLQLIGDDRIAIYLKNNKCYANPIYTTISLQDNNNVFNIKQSMPNYNNTKKIMLIDYNFGTNMEITSIIEPVICPTTKTAHIKSILLSNVLKYIIDDYATDKGGLVPTYCSFSDTNKFYNEFNNIKCYKLYCENNIDNNVLCIKNLILDNKGVPDNV